MEEVFLGSLTEPTPLLPLISLVASLDEIQELVHTCEAEEDTHEDRSRWLEAELIEKRFKDEIVRHAIIEWGPDSSLGESYIATISSVAMRRDLNLLILRWDEGLPHWWSFGRLPSQHGWLEKLTRNLEDEIGRSYTRLLEIQNL